jgi:hypothetical protein
VHAFVAINLKISTATRVEKSYLVGDRTEHASAISFDVDDFKAAFLEQNFSEILLPLFTVLRTSVVLVLDKSKKN